MGSMADSMRASIDAVEGALATAGFSTYQVYLLSRTTAPDGTSTIVSTRLVVGGSAQGDGYSTFAPPDGYLNPEFHQVSAKDAIQSGGLYNSKDWRLGPLVFTYNTGFSTGGFDLTIFQPQNIPGNRQKIALQVFGPGLPTAGQIFKLLYSEEDDNFAQYSYWSATGQEWT